MFFPLEVTLTVWFMSSHIKRNILKSGKLCFPLSSLSITACFGSVPLYAIQSVTHDSKNRKGEIHSIKNDIKLKALWRADVRAEQCSHPLALRRLLTLRIINRNFISCSYTDFICNLLRVVWGLFLYWKCFLLSVYTNKFPLYLPRKSSISFKR